MAIEDLPSAGGSSGGFFDSLGGFLKGAAGVYTTYQTNKQETEGQRFARDMTSQNAQRQHDLDMAALNRSSGSGGAGGGGGGSGSFLDKLNFSGMFNKASAAVPTWAPNAGMILLAIGGVVLLTRNKA